MPARVNADNHPRQDGRGNKNAFGMSLLITAIFFLVCLGLLHPGYAINDDIKIIAIAAGYPGTQPSPFLIFSNVLLGFLLVALYRLPSLVNWEIVLFLILDAASLVTLLYLIFSSAQPRVLRGLSAGLLLACASYFPLKITFTSTAALACSVGLIAILAGALQGRQSRALMAIGAALIFIGSLIRLEMLAIAAPPALVYTVVLRDRINWRHALLALAGAGMLVLSGFGVDKLYVRAHPEWNTFYAYTKAAQSVQDSHRLENVHTEIRRVGWSKNDQEVFARYFYPDADTYSLEHLKYLIDRVPGASQNPAYVFESFGRRLLAGRAALALLVCLSALMLMLMIPVVPTSIWAIPLIAATALAENLGLMWIYKSPDYVLMSTLANAALFAVITPHLPGSTLPATVTRSGWRRFAMLGALITFVAAMGLGVRQSIAESGENKLNEATYTRILHDIDQLRQDGSMASDALVISSSHGIPWHWANPLWIKFPSFAYVDTGWITFSPYYQGILQAHDLDPMPGSLVTNNRVYWASKPVFEAFLARYLEEHEGKTVSFETIYRLPDGGQPAGERGIELYRLVPSASGAP